MADGLFHSTDGHKYFADGKEVTGANNLVQKKSKSHHKISHKHKHKKHAKHHSAHSHKSKSHVEPPAKPISANAESDTKN